MKAYREEPEHRQTARVRAAAFRLANPDKRSDYARRRNALKRESAIGPITSAMLAAKREFWGDRCWMCGGVGSGWDHVKPLVKGGPHVLANLRPACIPCNMAKHDRWPYPTTPFADARR